MLQWIGLPTLAFLDGYLNDSDMLKFAITMATVNAHMDSFGQKKSNWNWTHLLGWISCCATWSQRISEDCTQFKVRKAALAWRPDDMLLSGPHDPGRTSTVHLGTTTGTLNWTLKTRDVVGRTQDKQGCTFTGSWGGGPAYLKPGKSPILIALPILICTLNCLWKSGTGRQLHLPCISSATSVSFLWISVKSKHVWGRETREATIFEPQRTGYGFLRLW